jgi:hypothetical protein
LKGFRVPGSKFRRIPRESLLAFMRENSIPLDNLKSGKYRVLAVDDEEAILDMLTELLHRDGRFEVRVARSGYEAGTSRRSRLPGTAGRTWSPSEAARPEFSTGWG